MLHSLTCKNWKVVIAGSTSTMNFPDRFVWRSTDGDTTFRVSRIINTAFPLSDTLSHAYIRHTQADFLWDNWFSIKRSSWCRWCWMFSQEKQKAMCWMLNTTLVRKIRCVRHLGRFDPSSWQREWSSPPAVSFQSALYHIYDFIANIHHIFCRRVAAWLKHIKPVWVRAC